MLCYTPTHLAPNKGGLEVSKKVQYVSAAQRAVKLCFVKLYEKLLQVWQAVVLQPIELQRRLQLFGNLQVPFIWSQVDKGGARL